MTRAHEEIINFIASGTTSRSVRAFSASPSVKARVEGLVRKRKSGSLLPAEEQELTDYLQLEHLMRLAKSRARTLVGGE
jgi:hypothetical protein